ncbi:endonuclease/exonuclease/phosphatase family protein [Phytohalomonas tamaricis]|uniref:endonuclease/exonuclease/phosphatase family protein n=1 Tax=Phytohalomonas tamaricis TaxID=2081032 RepID=UPI000D0B8401|nr:endonuclease/exonuclease/phosphatase family protein [Phytohalomonas tamaricis]
MQQGKTSEAPHVLKLLTFNLQVGIHTHAYHHYFTRSWQHFLPNAGRQQRLDLMGTLFHEYDVVGLQEVDGGSFRSGNINQVDYLAARAGFPYHFQQLNRNFGRFAKHSNGLLSRYPPGKIENHRLPGPPGRGAIHARFGEGKDALHIFVLHLSLGQRTQARQFDYICDIIEPLKHVIVMGDLNCTVEQLSAHPRFCQAIDLSPPKALLSYPAWQPRRALDHILLSSSLKACNPRVLDQMFSDHLPIAVDVQLPDVCARAIARTPRGGDTPTSAMV